MKRGDLVVGLLASAGAVAFVTVTHAPTERVLLKPAA